MPHVEVISSQTRDVSTLRQSLIFQKKIEIKVIQESSLENGLYCKILRLTRSLEKYCETFVTITLTSRKVDKGRIYHYIRQSQTQSRYHPRKLFLICHCSPCKKPLDSLLTRKKKFENIFQIWREKVIQFRQTCSAFLAALGTPALFFKMFILIFSYMTRTEANL